MSKKLTSEKWEAKILSLLDVSMQDCLVVVANNKGGVGKTTITQAYTDYAMYRGHNVYLAQVDRQERLSRLYDCPVVTIKSDPDSARENPEKEWARFSPIMDWADDWHGCGPLVLDLGANEVDRFSTWARLSMFEDELKEYGTSIVIFVVFTAEEQAIQEAQQTALAMQSAFPTAQIVYVENQRFGRIDDLKGDAAASYRQCIEPALNASPLVAIPRIKMNSYQHFEQLRLRFSEVVGLSTAEIMSITGLSKADSKMARSDVAIWLVSVFDQLDVLFGWTPSDETNL